jgi:hypothetical protein
MVAILPKQNTAIGQNIADILNEGLITQEKRVYLGYSGAGEPCLRKIWYSFRWASDDVISKQIKRTFDLGHILEAYIKTDLIANNFTITDEQLEVEGSYGHALGHIDGIICLPNSADRMLLEIKTSNALSWNAIVKRGVKKEKPAHYLQMQAYIGKLGLRFGLYVCYNKNTSEYYTELVELDASCYNDIDRKFNSVLMSEFPPDKIGDSEYYSCQWCTFKAVCHEQAMPSVNCRTCDFADIEMEGKWHCRFHDKFLTQDEQRIGCSKYKRSEVL